jgi:hypothetical protein
MRAVVESGQASLSRRRLAERSAGVELLRRKLQLALLQLGRRALYVALLLAQKLDRGAVLPHLIGHVLVDHLIDGREELVVARHTAALHEATRNHADGGQDAARRAGAAGEELGAVRAPVGRGLQLALHLGFLQVQHGLLGRQGLLLFGCLVQTARLLGFVGFDRGAPGLYLAGRGLLLRGARLADEPALRCRVLVGHALRGRALRRLGRVLRL